ncbi:hypothetical protein B0J11DRAFT_608171 [Dendryphion nanum]|uniref:AB hydrolase-1 domain-containing protein n=1 Tax=Dendryphion nanum TaxID=256645 RepID=A0A9P9IJC0_9PLEO|nr:hypothetical protein B0J11DRAFT_608171 [Dendryphion nanum]
MSRRLFSPAPLHTRSLFRLTPLFRHNQGYNYIPRTMRPASSVAYSQFQPVGNTIKLPTGRTLGYHTSGDSKCIPVIYIHGNPDSGIQVTGDLETKVAEKLGIHWIGPDRPRIGLSTPYKQQQVLHYSQDVKSLADHLSLDK